MKTVEITCSNYGGAILKKKHFHNESGCYTCAICDAEVCLNNLDSSHHVTVTEVVQLEAPLDTHVSKAKKIPDLLLPLTIWNILTFLMATYHLIPPPHAHVLAVVNLLVISIYLIVTRSPLFKKEK